MQKPPTAYRPFGTENRWGSRTIKCQLPNAGETITSEDIDASRVCNLHEQYHIAIELPAFTAAELPAGTSLNIELQGGNSPRPEKVHKNNRHITAGTGQDIEARLVVFKMTYETPPFMNVKFTLNGKTGDLSGKTFPVHFVY